MEHAVLSSGRNSADLDMQKLMDIRPPLSHHTASGLGHSLGEKKTPRYRRREPEGVFRRKNR
jgi:hypothetical protein